MTDRRMFLASSLLGLASAFASTSTGLAAGGNDMARIAELVSSKLSLFTDSYNAQAKTLITPVYNVVGYGANGDGVTDDTAAIQTAINAAIAAGEKVVYFPHGTYKVTSLTGLSSVVLLGDNASFSGIPNQINQLGDTAAGSDFGVMTRDYVIAGGVATKDGVVNNKLNVTEIKAVVGSLYKVVAATSFTTSVVSTTYYLDFKSDGTYSFATSHAAGTYIPAAEVVTDASGNISTVTDKRGLVGGIQGNVNGVVNVLAFGAKGDAVADDTAAIQAAIDALGTTGGIVYIPKGVYVVKSPLLLHSGVHIVGDGYDSDLECMAVMTAMFKNKDEVTLIDDVSIENLTVTGNIGSFAGNKGIQFVRVSRWKVSGVRIRSCDVALYVNNGYFGYCEDTFFLANTIGVQAGSATFTERPNVLHLNSCFFQLNTSKGVYFQSLEGGKLTNCSFESSGSGLDSGNAALTLGQAYDTVIDGCYFDANAGDALYLGATSLRTVVLGGTFTGNGFDIRDKTAGNYQFVTSVKSARAYHNVAQSTASGTTATLAFNSERWDTDGIHDNVTNNSRLTCKTAGKYIITGNVAFAANATGYRRLQILKNATTYIGDVLAQAVSVAAVGTNLNISCVEDLAVGDYVELQVTQNSGGALDVLYNANFSPEFSMIRMG